MIYTVSEINNVIKNTLHAKFKGQTIKISGEISGLKYSGVHTYLTLKENTSSISVQFWRQNLKFSNGDHVEIEGKINYYQGNGSVNIVGSSIKLVGEGVLHAEYEKLKESYDKKGYFNNKKPLPSSIKRVGIVTSFGGAALHDLLHVLDTGGFSGEIYIYDCVVQGVNCGTAVSKGIKFFNSPFFIDPSKNIDLITSKTISKSIKKPKDDRSQDSDYDIFESNESSDSSDSRSSESSNSLLHGSEYYMDVEVDIIVVTRGGGSFEDLIGFSDPKVIEAIHTSTKYVISAVGHHVDNMLSDYVANFRAATPSIAGEVLCSVNLSNKVFQKYETEILNIRNSMIQDLFRFRSEVRNRIKCVVDPGVSVEKILDRTAEELVSIRYGLIQKLARLKTDIERIKYSIPDPCDELNAILTNYVTQSNEILRSKLNFYRSRLTKIRSILTTSNVNNILKEGFILLTDTDGNIVKNMSDVFDNNLTLIHETGRYQIVIQNIIKIKQKKKQRLDDKIEK